MLIIPLKEQNIGRSNPDNSISEVHLRYNDQPKPQEKCNCGKNKKYLRCCGKTAKVKYKELVIKFVSTVDKEHHLELAPDGVFIYTDGERATILSSEIRTTYKKKGNKRHKVVNKISIPGLMHLVTPDNVFSYFDVVLAVDTNTDIENNISVCSIVSVHPDKTKPHSTFSVDPQKGISVGRLSGETMQEMIFSFKATETKNENTAWYAVTEIIRRYTDFGAGLKYALIVDSDLDNLDDYNCRLSPYVKNYYLPDGMYFIYASSDLKNNSLLNYAIHFADKNSTAALEEKREYIIRRLQGKSNLQAIAADVIFLNMETQIFTKAVPEIDKTR